jgi:ankyrin repeat protein/beta-lactamase regulating signal transducer with metallopeptidase domain
MTIPEAVLALSRSPELSVLLKATVLLTFALAVVRMSGHARASVRHLVLASTFAALAALPLVIAAAPGVRVDIAITPSKTVQAVAAPIPAVISPSTAAPGAAPGWVIPSWTMIVRVLWAGGAMLQLGFLGWQLLRLRRIQRTGVPWLEGRDLTRILAAECGVSRTVDVLLHEEIPAPVTCGALRPVVLLPFGVRTWSEDDLRRALIHELEHVRRRDWAMQQVARAAVACYWFHPLVWVTWRRLCLEAERAADDAVLRTAQSAEYAEQLVGLARCMSNAEAHPVLGMANRSDLSARVSAMLDRNQRRGRAGFLAATGAIAAAALILAMIGPLTAVAQSSLPRNAEAESRRATALERALYEAAEAGDLRDIDELLKSGASVNAVIHGDGTPLLGAARKGQLAAVTFLLGRGADPNVPVPGDGTALIAAAAGGHGDIVSLLLDRGADPNLGVPGDGNPLIMAASEGRAEMVSLLLGRGARIEDVVPGDENALCKASEQGQLNVVKLLVDRGANVNVRIWVKHARGQDGEWRSPLIMARRGRHQAVIDFLIASGARE